MGSSISSRLGSEQSCSQKSTQMSHVVLLEFVREAAMPAAVVVLIMLSSAAIASRVAAGQVANRAVWGTKSSFLEGRPCPINERNENRDQRQG
jgi:hypothetical protein